MKQTALVGLWIILAISAFSQPSEHTISQSKAGILRTQTELPKVADRGRNHTRWEWTTQVETTDGKTVSEPHAYIELAAGLNYRENGQWKETKEEFELIPGWAVAWKGPHKVSLAYNLNVTGSVVVDMPDGKRQRSHVLGLCYLDASTSQSAMIATVKTSEGKLLPPNQVIYEDAFDGIEADVRYTYTKAGVEQDVIIRAKLPSPEDYGLNPAGTKLVVLTEFLDNPAPEVKIASTRINETDSSLGVLTDVEVDFGSMHIGRGKAFMLEKANPQGGSRRRDIPVYKKWVNYLGRQVLFEEVPVSEVQEELDKLPDQASARLKTSKTMLADLVLPALPVEKPADKEMLVAAVQDQYKSPGYVLDYTMVNSGLTNFIFQGDMTYYVSGTVNLYGTNTIEGGTVIKFNPDAATYLTFQGGVVQCQTEPYRMAFFTSKNDNSVGETLPGSTGSPTPIINDVYYLILSGISDANLHDIRMAYGFDPLTTINCSNVVVSGLQILHSYYPVYPVSTVGLKIRNALFYNTPADAFWIDSSSVSVEHATIYQCSNLGFKASMSGATLAITNSLLVDVSSLGDVPLTTNSVYVTTGSMNFQTVGGGSHYLAVSSPYRSIGTTNIDPTLLAELKQRTTYPPLVYSNQTISTNLSLGQYATRDTNSWPDIGYHYAPLDYVFGGCLLTTNLTFTEGTIVGWFQVHGSVYAYGQPYAMVLNDGASMNFEGTLDDPAGVARFNIVQEGNGSWSGTGWMGGFLLNGSGSSPRPQINSRFTKWAGANGFAGYYRDIWNYGDVRATHCEFLGDWTSLYGASSYFTNCLFNRMGLNFYGDADSATITMLNCTFREGVMIMKRYSWGSPSFWRVENCAFDGMNITTYDELSANTNSTYMDYNAFNPSNTNWMSHPFSWYGAPKTNVLEVAGPHDVTVTNYYFQTGPLGDFYLPSNSPLINVGSTNANLVGLYHFTTTTNQLKETNSVVDIGHHFVALDSSGKPIDTDGDGLPDYLEDTNGNGSTDGAETGWTDYFNGVAPTLSIVAGNNQTDMPSVTMSTALKVRLTSSGGTPVANADIGFTVTQGGATISTSSNGTFAGSQNVPTDSNGEAAVFMRLPDTISTAIAMTASFSNALYNVQTNFSESTMMGAKLWLLASAGITNSSVNRWSDQSGNGFDATQTTLANQPVLVDGVLNGQPVVRFDGTNDYFTLPNLLNGTTQAEAFVVLKAAADVPTGNRALWYFGSGGTGGRYPATDGTISESFGSTTMRNIGNPAQPLDSFHLYDVAGKSNEWSARINGLIQSSVTGNTYGTVTSPTLGRGNLTTTTFHGDMAEVLVFSRVLSDGERASVGSYLSAKYALVTNPPTAPTNLVATAISSNQVSLTWGYTLTNSSTRFQIERKTGAGGVYAQVAEVADTTSYVDTNLVAGTTYYYRVMAVNYAGTSAYSSEANATTSTSTAPLPLGELRLWLKADAGAALQASNAVMNWHDQSGKANHGTQTTVTNQPVWVDGVLNGQPVLRFDGIGDRFTLPNLLNGTTQAEAFVVLKATADMPTGNRALWSFGTTGGGGRYPATDGTITEGFGSTTTRNIGNPAQPLDSFHLYDVAGKSNEWSARINGLIQSSVTGNTYTTNASPQLGYGLSSGIFFAGDMAEVLVFSRVLSDGERASVGSYLSAKYALVTNPPTAPTNLVATAISSNQVSLTWGYALTNSSTRFQIERKTGAGGVYAQVAEVADTTSYVDTNLVAGTTYYYRVMAINYAGTSAYSSEANATTSTSSAPLPLGELRLWLKADAGAALQASNAVMNWHDQSGKANHGTQTTVTNQPVWVDGVLNGQPVLRFDGIGDRFTLPNLLNGTTQAEAFVVLKAAADVPTGNRALWSFGTTGGGGRYPATDGTITEGFGSTTTRNIGNPAQPLDSFHLYDVAGKSNEWSARINGLIQSSVTGNTYTTNASPQLGYGLSSGIFFAGDMAEVLVFSRVLSDGERDSVFGYLNAKYQFLQLPLPPTNLVANALSPTQVSLTWSNVSPATTIEVERKIGTNGTFAPLVQLGIGTTNYLDTNIASGEIYLYRLRSANLIGYSPYSSEASAVPNIPPTVIMDLPLNGQLFESSESIILSASPSDADGTISKVEFFLGGTNKLGECLAPPYTLVWSTSLAGSYSFVATATDNWGATNASSSVGVTVTNGNISLTLTSPTNSAQFSAPASILLESTASASVGSITEVQFYAGDTLLATDTTAPYSVTWANVPAGDYYVTAKARDSLGNIAASSGASVTVYTTEYGAGVQLRVYTPLQ